ncbi:MAG: tRNA (cytidine(56)-2'-O)-methyltransferase [Candidatus Thermoplasmatota archaeon]|nr:tRNA (cytidine(56)-2'-O)-methyltransferase [Candidatus Thermoplasmatota archaeon]
MTAHDLVVLRIGHRPERDKRVTTHVALVSRAMGADSIIISTKDQSVEDTVNDVADRFGGPFEISTGVKWRRVLEEWDGIVVHLTMYGLPVDQVMKDFPRDKPVLVVVGAEKVPREVYDRADYNISVGNQPHSEIAALAIFLDRFFQGKALEKEFNGKLRIEPMERGKKVVETGEDGV